MPEALTTLSELSYMGHVCGALSIWPELRNPEAGFFSRPIRTGLMVVERCLPWEASVAGPCIEVLLVTMSFFKPSKCWN